MMAVTAALTGRYSRYVAIKQGNWRATGRVKEIRRLPCEELPLGSFDGYYNFVSSDQIQTTARSGFDGARVNVKLFNLLAQRIVSASQSLDVRLHMHKLLRRHRHPNLRPCDHGNANRGGGENDHAKNDPRGNDAPTAADLGRRTDDVD